MSELKPALTPDEWAESEVEGHYVDGKVSVHVDHKGRIFVTDETTDHVTILNESYDAKMPLALIALCNHVLPDDSPYKITQADVDFLEWVAEQMRKMNPISSEDEATLNRITAKLTALLPPDNA